MKTLDLVPGSPEWLAFRKRPKARNASEASIIMGCNPKMTRAEFVRLRATGGEREYSRYIEEVVFPRGHAVEAAARPIAEAKMGVRLYPVTGESEEYPGLSASFDGIDMAETSPWECKQWNESKAADVRNGIVPKEDYWQVVQGLIVSRAPAETYAVTDGTTERYVDCTMTLDEADERTLLAAWAQFEADVAAWVPEPVKVEAVGRAPIQLPSLYVELAGGVQATNLPAFKAAALEVFNAIPTELSTDQDFADAAETVKWCEDIEERLKAAKANAQGQMVTVDELFRTIDDLSSAARSKRLVLDKLVTARKEELRVQIAVDARRDYEAHLAAINKDLAVPVLGHNAFMDTVTAAMKGKKTLESLRAAASQAAATAKIAASNEATRHMQNIVVLVDAGRHELFGDRDALVRSKQPEDLRNLVAARIAEADKREADRLEAQRQQIRAEEEARANAAAEALAETERERIRQEEQAKARAEAAEPKGADGLPQSARRIYADEPPPAIPQTQPAGPGPIQPQPALQDVLDAAAPAPVADAMRSADFAPVLLPTAKAALAANELTRPGATLKLGQINERIAPLTITGEGLERLGFKPVGTDKSAKLYAASQLPDMCRAMGRVLKTAIDAATAPMEKAA